MILSLAAEPDRLSLAPVSAPIIADVDALIREFILPHAFEFYGSGDPGSERLRALASWILTSGKTRIVPSDLTTNVRDCRGLGIWDINQRVSPLVAGGWLTPEQPGPMGNAWKVNPQVAAFFAARTEIEERRKATVAALMKSPRRPRS